MYTNCWRLKAANTQRLTQQQQPKDISLQIQGERDEKKLFLWLICTQQLSYLQSFLASFLACPSFFLGLNKVGTYLDRYLEQDTDHLMARGETQNTNKVGHKKKTLSISA
jgi:hypothetical protein